MLEILVFVEIFTICVAIRFKDDVVVEIETGKIRGFHNAGYHTFRGIPYAKPPINDLRFEPPQKITERWNGTEDLVAFGSPCAQFIHFNYLLYGDEDCLYLNVYVPDEVMRQPPGNPKKAGVIVHIHGGSFMYGTGNIYGPENLVAENLILVTFNYRVGIFGFLSSENEELSGNLGLKDQVAALQWVQRNIAAFNGNASSVTISGDFAGAASVHLHYFSKMSEGLFKNGISHSGVALNPWVLQENARGKFDVLVKAMECYDIDDWAAIYCLKKVPTMDILEFTNNYMKYLYNPFSPFGVVIELDIDGSFLIEHPLKLLEQGKVKTLPWLIFQVQNAGLYPTAEFYNYKYMQNIAERWIELCPYLLDFKETKNDCNSKIEMCKEIKKFYLDIREINVDSFKAFTDIFTDRLYHYGAHKAATLQCKHGATHFFSFESKTGNYLQIGPWMEVLEHQRSLIPRMEKDYLGVAPGSEVFLIFFSMTSRGPNMKPYSEKELKVGRDLAELYSDFNLGNTPFFEKYYVPSLNDKLYTFDFIDVGTVRFNTDRGEYGYPEFWDKLKIED